MVSANLVNIGSDDGLLPDDTRTSPVPLLTLPLMKPCCIGMRAIFARNTQGIKKSKSNCYTLISQCLRNVPWYPEYQNSNRALQIFVTFGFHFAIRTAQDQSGNSLWNQKKEKNCGSEWHPCPMPHPAQSSTYCPPAAANMGVMGASHDCSHQQHRYMYYVCNTSTETHLCFYR